MTWDGFANKDYADLTGEFVWLSRCDHLEGMNGVTIRPYIDCDEDVEFDAHGHPSNFYVPIQVLADILRANGYTVEEP